VVFLTVVAAVLSLLWRRRAVLRMDAGRDEAPFLLTRSAARAAANQAPAPAPPSAQPSSGRGRGRGRGGRGRGSAGRDENTDLPPHSTHSSRPGRAGPSTRPSDEHTFNDDDDTHHVRFDAGQFADDDARPAAPPGSEFITKEELRDLLSPITDNVQHTLQNMKPSRRSCRARSPSVSEDDDDDVYSSDDDADTSHTPWRTHNNNKKKKSEPFSLPSAGIPDLDSNKSARDRHHALADVAGPILKLKEKADRMARDPTIPTSAARSIDKHASA